ncbi:MAG: 2-hydroxyacyl-CoA dehydratase [Deltaproteobacteria bacterium]|nr:2-hydroxyacyl-CoA dehydratase [Deltaproteobacteria bacterium]
MSVPEYYVKTDKSIKYLAATKKVYPLVTAYYEEAARVKADHSKKIGYTTGAGIVDLLNVFYDSVLPVLPENFNAGCAAKQITPPLLEIAESEGGYSKELCGYFRNATGYLLGGKNLDLEFPGGGMPPEPDFMIGDSGACTFHLKWWRDWERFFGYRVPNFIFDLPYIPPRMSMDQIDASYLQYTVQQIKEALHFLEKVSGQPFEEEKLMEVVRYSSEAGDLFNEVQEMRRNRPCPAGAEDILSCIMPLVQWSGRKEATDFYRELRDEVKGLVEQKKGPVEKEEFRLLFDNIPPWFTLGIFNYVHRFNAVVAMETYSRYFNLARGRMDPDKPYESLARKFLYGCVFKTSVRETIHDSVAALCKDFSIDGIISFVLYGCKISSGFLPLQKHVLENEYGIPTLVLEGDMVDPRDYADSQVKNRIEAFMELLASKKAASREV